MDGSVQTHVRLHINTLSQVGHDPVYTGLEVCPSVSVRVSGCTGGRWSGGTYVPAESSLVGMGGIGDGIVDRLGGRPLRSVTIDAVEAGK